MSRELTHVSIDDNDKYRDAVYRAIEDRYPPPWPSTVAQLHTLAEIDPERARACLPRDGREIERLGLSPFVGRTVPPFSQRFRERLLATLIDDHEFRDAVRSTIGGAE